MHVIFFVARKCYCRLLDETVHLGFINHLFFTISHYVEFILFYIKAVYILALFFNFSLMLLFLHKSFINTMIFVFSFKSIFMVLIQNYHCFGYGFLPVLTVHGHYCIS